MRLAMPPKITGQDLNEHEWECDWAFWGSSSLLSSRTSSSVTVWGLMVVVGSSGGTDSGTKASPPSFLSCPFHVCCEWMLHEKPQASILLEVDYWSVLRAATTTTTNSRYTLSGRTGSALAWHTQGRVLAPRMLQQVLWFVAHIYTLQYVELRRYFPCRVGGNG